ncbi:MAG: hypothetical protein ACTHL3_02430 [Candidatus Nitrosocosmicus sp.]
MEGRPRVIHLLKMLLLETLIYLKKTAQEYVDIKANQFFSDFQVLFDDKV